MIIVIGSDKPMANHSTTKSNKIAYERYNECFKL